MAAITLKDIPSPGQDLNLLTAWENFKKIQAGYSGSLTLTGPLTVSSLSASLPVFTDSAKALVSNPMTGTGSVVMSASPTFTGTLSAAKGLFISDFTIGASALAVGSPLTYAGGTGAMVLSPTSFEIQVGTTLRAANGASEYDLTVKASRGSIASPTNVVNNDAILNLNVAPYSGGTYFTTGQILIFVDGTFTSGQRPPSRIEFYTNQANTANALALTLSGAQVATFGGEVKLSSANTVNSSILSTVTNKIKVNVGGTDYYLLANTSNA